MISAIVAVDNNWGIGFNGDLLEHIPEDLKRFKELTFNKVVVMGRKTWDSLPKKPLPNRLNLVITRQGRFVDEMTIFMGLEEITSRLKHLDDEDHWFIIGGGEIYKTLLPFCDNVYVTKIFKTYNKVDTYFPNLDNDPNWEIIEQSEVKTYKDIQYQFQLYGIKN